MKSYIKEHVDGYAELVAMALIVKCQRDTIDGSCTVSVRDLMSVLSLSPVDYIYIHNNTDGFCDMVREKVMFHDDIVAECVYDDMEKEWDITMYTDMCCIESEEEE